MKVKLMATMATMVMTLLVFAGVAMATEPPDGTPPEIAESVRITVGGVTITGVAEGDTVHEGAIPDGEGEDVVCDIPSVRIQFSGDVRRVRVGLAEGTCNLIVRELEFNSSVPTLPPVSDDGQGQQDSNTGGHEWYVESLAKVVGINSIDDLTKTYAWFNFKTANFTGGGPVFDGSEEGGRCWAANFPTPF